MSDKIPDKLFRLIHSLSRSEKRYFKIMASHNAFGENSNYVKLFDAIDAMEEYSEEDLARLFRKESFYKNPSIAKNRLYENILRSLDAFHAKSSVDVELRRMLHCAEILFSKSMYDESHAALVKARKIAIQYEKHHILLDISKWQKKLMERDSYAGKGLEDVISLLDEDNLLLKKISNYAEFWNIKSRLFLLLNKKGKVRDQEELKNFKKIIDNTLLKSENKALSYETRFLYNHIYSAYFFGIGDYQNSYRYIKKHLALIESKAEIFNEEPNKYFAVLSNMIYLCAQLRKFNEVAFYLSKLKGIPELMERGMTEDMEIKLFSSAYSAELSLYIQTGEFEKALEIIPVIESGIKKFNINKVRASYFNFNIAIVYFASGDYSSSLKWINKLLNDNSIDANNDIHCFSRIFNLIIHLEMGNNEVIPYTLKSTYRYLDKRKRMYRFENVFLLFINQYLKAKNNQQVKASYQSLKNELQVLLKDPFEKVVFEYFDFNMWAESKVANRSFAQVVKSQLEI
jgi:hypothetical protein